MSSLLADAATVEFGGREPWPNDVVLYQPYEADQILLSDFADTLSVKAFLKMGNLDYKVQVKTNAEFMSPTGKVPFIQIGNLLVAELDPIIALAVAKGHNLSAHLDSSQRADMRAYMAMVENVIVNTELYLVWHHEDTWRELTLKRCGSPYPWPLSLLLPWKKRLEKRRKLKATGWTKKTLDEIFEEVTTCCKALSEKLGKQKYFFGDQPTELDALVFGHLYTIMTTKLPPSVEKFTNIVQEYQNLRDFVKHVEKQFFRETLLESS